MGKSKSGCIWYFILFIILLIGLVYIFSKVAPKTAQNAKEEVIERMFGVSIDKGGNKVDSVVVIAPKETEAKKDTIKDYAEVPLEVLGNVSYVVAKVNGVDMRFILDTGCSDMQITMAEFYYLKHMGIINDSDLGPQTKCVYANGDEGVCHTLTIKSLMLGGAEARDVVCTVEENIDGPLLLGQGVLEKLGEVIIDYKEKVIKVKNEK